jgi:O-antigen/teichoic acid export membrane protein
MWSSGAKGIMARVSEESARAAGEAADATRGSAIKLGAEIASRLLTLATTLLLLRGLGAEGFGRLGELQVYALLLAELGELGLQTLASRALVAGTISLRSFVRARLVLLALVAVVALAAAPFAPALSWLLGWFALSGWGEFLGVALRCRRARVEEALVLLVLRGGGLVAAVAALALGAGVVGVAGALAVSPLPALALGAGILRRTRAVAPEAALDVREVLRASFPLAVHGGLVLLSPRVEFLVLTWMRGARETGLFLAGLNVFWFLSMVPSAVAAGAMPALTREAVRGEGPVRRRTAATLAVLAAPAAVGLALLSDPLARLLLGPGYAPVDYAATSRALLILAAAVPPLFLNWLLAAALIAAGRAALLPRLTATRVAAAFVMALLLVPRLGGAGAAAGIVLAEWLLCGLFARACHASAFPVPVLKPVAVGLVVTAPMALAVASTAWSLVVAVAIGGLTWAATLAAVWRLQPSFARELLGNSREGA